MDLVPIVSVSKYTGKLEKEQKITYFLLSLFISTEQIFI